MIDVTDGAQAALRKEGEGGGAENEAFIAESNDERRLVQEMRAGANMTVEAVSSRGTDVSYNFSLKGVTAALRQARSLCG